MLYTESCQVTTRETGRGFGRLCLGRNVGTNIIASHRSTAVDLACANKRHRSAFFDPQSESRYEKEERPKREAKLGQEADGPEAEPDPAE